MKNYFENAIVEKVWKKSDYHERDIVFRVNNRAAKTSDDKVRLGSIECFEYKNAGFEEGKEYLLKLRLLDFSVEKIKIKEKKAVYIKHTPMAVNEYDLYGEVVDRINDEVVIDCGFYVFINNNEMRKGDWVKAHGRLDVFLGE